MCLTNECLARCIVSKIRRHVRGKMELYLYADNWQLKGYTVNATSEAFEALLQFTDISRLHMANST